MIKKGYTKQFGFTLIEIMVAITIIWIIGAGVANTNWSRLSDRQKVSIFKNRMVSQIETIRNNALFGRSITINSIVPRYWRIDFWTNTSNVFYSTWWLDPSDFLPYDVAEMNLSRFESISSVDCGWEPRWSILIEWINMSLTGSVQCAAATTILMDLEYKQFSESIEINSVSGLVKTLP